MTGERSTGGGGPEEEVTLLELLDRLLDKGVVLSGDITLSVADVDLVYLSLRLLLSSTEAARRQSLPPGPASAGTIPHDDEQTA